MTTTSRSRTRTKIGSGIAGVGLAALAVLGFSNAAFHAETDNAQNNWATEGFVTLDDDLTAPLFSVGLDGAPMPYTGSYDAEIPVGSGISNREITVNFGGSARADIRLYVDDGYAATRGLDDDTTVTVHRQGVTEPIYEGSLAEMPDNYADAEDTQWLAGPAAASSTYTFSIETDADAEDGATLGNVKFVWAAEQAAPAS